MSKITISTTASPHLYWSGPLPAGAAFCGTVTRDDYDTGALIRMRTGIYAQGNAGAIRTLPQRQVAASLAAAALGRMGGAATTPAKAAAAARNGAAGGRPKKQA